MYTPTHPPTHTYIHTRTAHTTESKNVNAKDEYRADYMDNVLHVVRDYNPLTDVIHEKLAVSPILHRCNAEGDKQPSYTWKWKAVMGGRLVMHG